MRWWRSYSQAEKVIVMAVFVHLFPLVFCESLLLEFTYNMEFGGVGSTTAA